MRTKISWPCDVCELALPRKPTKLSCFSCDIRRTSFCTSASVSAVCASIRFSTYSVPSAPAATKTNEKPPSLKKRVTVTVRPAMCSSRPTSDGAPSDIVSLRSSRILVMALLMYM